MPEAPANRDPALQELLDKQAIREVVMRYCRAVDRGDLEMLASVYHPDARDDRNGETTTGEAVPASILRPTVERMASTNHQITTQLIVVEGDQAASESYSTGSHLLKDGRRLRTLVRYVDRFERRKGQWRISHRQMILEHSELHPALEAIAGAPPTAARRDRSDPSYANFEL